MGKLTEKQHEVLDFLCRRFRNDCNWLTGNCYYFAVIYAERFKKDNPIIYYDTINGHFVCNIDGTFYDWSGIVEYEPEFVEKYVMKWDDLYNEDSVWGNRIIRDVIL